MRSHFALKLFAAKTNSFRNRIFQIGSLHDCEAFTNAIGIDGDIVTVMSKLQFVQIKFTGNGRCNYVQLCHLQYNSTYLRRHYLFQNWMRRCEISQLMFLPVAIIIFLLAAIYLNEHYTNTNTYSNVQKNCVSR